MHSLRQFGALEEASASSHLDCHTWLQLNSSAYRMQHRFVMWATDSTCIQMSSICLFLSQEISPNAPRQDVKSVAIIWKENLMSWICLYVLEETYLVYIESVKHLYRWPWRTKQDVWESIVAHILVEWNWYVSRIERKNKITNRDREPG